MKVNELSKQLGITNKELITFLKGKDYKISSHMQNVPDEVLTETVDYFTELKKSEEDKPEEKKEQKTKKQKVAEKPEHDYKKFKADDIIVCRSVVPYKLNAVGLDKTKVYHWEYFGDIDYLEYRDLQALRRTDYITKPLIMIDY